MLGRLIAVHLIDHEAGLRAMILDRSAMQKREIATLETYVIAKGKIGYVKGGGWLTTERLAVRGFVAIVQERGNDRFPTMASRKRAKKSGEP